MVSINASTKHSVSKKIVAPKTSQKGGKGTKSSSSKTKRGGAVKLTPDALCSPAKIESLKAMDDGDKVLWVSEIFGKAMGEVSLHGDLQKPRAASTTRDRSHAAADLGVACKELGLKYIMKECNIFSEIRRMLLPLGNDALFADVAAIKKSASGVSLASLESDASYGSLNTNTVDSKRGKTTPAPAREGSLLILRALCEIVGKPAEPYVVPFLGAALDESGSSSGALREAAEDTSVATVALAHPYAVPTIIVPTLFRALTSPEWRVKHNALERMAQCAATAPKQICNLLPKIIPKVTDQVWDTKPQVTKAASTTLLEVCSTNRNPDVKQAIPAVVKAVCKPTDTVKAIEELMATTFVATVDAPTLSILCPVLSRGLKERMALHKRATCIVIENMSRLVSSPTAVAPFGPLLVPELKKVAENVQFEEIRDAALAALKALTKALGHADVETALAALMAEELRRVEEEQKRIEDKREAEQKREEELAKQAEEEKRLFKEAMDAQRQLDRIAEQEEEEKKAEEMKKREKEKLSTKKGGKCQQCGLKKCKKSCLFYTG